MQGRTDSGSEEEEGMLALGETTIAADGRGARSLTLFSRAKTAALINHAVATSDDGGQTWSEAQPLPSLVGPTCQGAVGPALVSGGGQGKVVLTAPLSHDGGLTGRENVVVWELDPRNQTSVKQTPVIGRLWPCKGAYSAFTDDGEFNLFEAGEIYRYETLTLVRMRDANESVGPMVGPDTDGEMTPIGWVRR